MKEALTWKTYLGVFFLTTAAILFEILLTRIFSVTMWYHFAFMAISVALFGIAVGAVIVYLFPRLFPQDRIHVALGACCLLFSVTAVLGLIGHLLIPFTPELTAYGLMTVIGTYLTVAVPFVFNGIAVCLILTRFHRHVSRLYAVDLIGAGIGCVFIIGLLSFADAPTAVFIVAILGCVASLLFLAVQVAKKLIIANVVLILVLVSVVELGISYSSRNDSLFPFKWVKGEPTLFDIFHHSWNHYSYIRLHGDMDTTHLPLGWGISRTWPTDRRVFQTVLNIDGHAGTMLTRYTGKFEEIEHLTYDITNLVHYLRDDAHLLAIGVGGGRDILSAIAFGQRMATGVEFNTNILRLLTHVEPFRTFTGDLGNRDDVNLVNEEARSFLHGTREQFDIIQVSLIDTWAATAAGAFALTENSLYTKEAWHLMFDRLTDDGVITFSRWFYANRPHESWRMTALAVEVLRERGIENPRDHILFAKTDFMWPWDTHPDYGIGTIMVGKSPFSERDREIFHRMCEKFEFIPVLSPDESHGFETFETIVNVPDPAQLRTMFPINIWAPTDNSPFFFHMVKFRDFFRTDIMDQGVISFNNQGATVLVLLLITVTLLALLTVILPLALRTNPADLKGSSLHLLYFVGIGFGFMFVEISQLQKLNLILGHPTYSLSVVLFTILISSGLGSLTTNRLKLENLHNPGLKLLVGLLVSLLLYGLLAPPILEAVRSQSTMIRVFVSGLLLVPIGFMMGMAFPIGMKLAELRNKVVLTPWLWGVNGATSVCGSVLTVVVSISYGIAQAYWVGVLFYILVLTCFYLESRKGPAV